MTLKEKNKFIAINSNLHFARAADGCEALSDGLSRALFCETCETSREKTCPLHYLKLQDMLHDGWDTRMLASVPQWGNKRVVSAGAVDFQGIEAVDFLGRERRKNEGDEEVVHFKDFSLRIPLYQQEQVTLMEKLAEKLLENQPTRESAHKQLDGLLLLGLADLVEEILEEKLRQSSPVT